MKGLRRIHAELGIPHDYAKQRGLARQREAMRLVVAGRTPDGKQIRLTRMATTAWHRMQSAAAQDHVTLLPISGFRSVRRQTAIIRAKLRRGHAIDDILSVVAAPGFSEHHTGQAIDIGSPEDSTLQASFAKTAAFRWLKRRAAEFGFHLSYPPANSHGIQYEPWHWRWFHPATGR